MLKKGILPSQVEVPAQLNITKRDAFFGKNAVLV